MYLPVFAGSALHETVPDGFTADNEGENISFLNPMYSELTALYWGWKNLPDITKEDSFIGLVHYRRLFGTKRKGAISYEDIAKYLKKKKIFVPTAREYFVDTLKAHYCQTHGSATLDECEKVLAELCPEYLKSFDRALGKSSGYMFNMMILRGDVADQYLTWLFRILYELTLRVDSSGMDDFDKRYPGRISELLFNVWLDHMIEQGEIRHSDIKVLPWYTTTGENTIEKAEALLKAKFKGEKYHKSF
ncbi:hypothetical protein SAMN02910456_00702 [Ruminococcaceae bacterium YRB3002]|nr:hypothetical protein SAMN02910456_00702 [Ruminococcaceae bacterium YRB3002]